MPVSAKERGEEYRDRQHAIGRRARTIWATDAEFQMLKDALAKIRQKPDKQTGLV